MKRIEDFPGGLDKPYDELMADLDEYTEHVRGGHHWTVFQHNKWNDDVWFIWCNEGYGMMLYDYELRAINELLAKRNAE